MHHLPPSVIRFGPFEFDSRSRELRKNGMRVKLTPHEMSLLCLLLEPPLRARTRDEIQRDLWPANTFVDFEHGMNKVVHSLREALGDSATDPHYIETVNATGYRFLPQLLKSELADKRDLFKKPASIAVLPIATTGPDDLVHHCDRITFHLVAALSAFRHRVMAQATIRSFKLNGAAPRQAGEILGVDAVISGELVRIAGTLSLSAELIDVADGSLLCGAYTEAAETTGNLLDEQLAHDVLQRFRPLLNPSPDDHVQLSFDSRGFPISPNGKPTPRRRATDFM